MTHLWLVPDDTVHKGTNRPPFGTQGSLTFYIAIYPYKTTLYYFLYFILQAYP